MKYPIIMKDKDILTITEFAELIRVHPNSVRNMIKKGRLSAFRIGGGATSAYRIPRSEIQRLSITDLEKIVESMVHERIKENNL